MDRQTDRQGQILMPPDYRHGGIKFFPSEEQPPPSRLCAQSARYSLQIYFQIKDSKSGKLCVLDICTCSCQVLTVVAGKSEVL